METSISSYEETSPPAAPTEMHGEILAQLEELLAGSGDPEQLSDAAVQVLLAVAVRVYATRMEAVDRMIEPFPRGMGLEVTATQGAIAADAILADVGVELFELGMWRMWGGT